MSKKAFRILAKENHPDRFTGLAEKQKYGQKMIEINSAYKTILSGREEWVKHKIENEAANSSTDTVIYKQGKDYYNRHYYSYSIFLISVWHLPLSVTNKKLMEENQALLLKARDCFSRVVNEFPDSDWAFDSEERIKKIDRTLEEMKRSYNTHYGKTGKGTPVSGGMKTERFQ